MIGLRKTAAQRRTRDDGIAVKYTNETGVEHITHWQLAVLIGCTPNEIITHARFKADIKGFDTSKIVRRGQAWLIAQSDVPRPRRNKRDK